MTNFYAVKNVPAAGNSSTVIKYSAEDADPFSASAYYRLSEIDLNGQKQIFDMIPVKGCGQDNFTMDVYPTLASSLSNVNVQFTGKPNASVLLVVRDVLGKQFYSKFLVLENGNYLFTFDKEETISSGVYFISASSNDSFRNRKVVIR